jgi:pimeloyl-ACP methyl ester carboxylesterase
MNARTIRANGLEFAAVEAGEQHGDKLLLVHGFTGAKEDFEDHIDALAATGWHVVAADHRGHGASSKPDGEDSYSMAVMAEDMASVVDELGWDRFVLLGHSMGGMVAQHMAAALPDRLAGLVLMDTSPVCPDGLDVDSVLAGREVVRQSGLEPLIQLLADGGGPLSTPAHERLCETRPGYKERGDNNTRNCSPAMWCAIVTEIVDQPDRLELLRDVEAPALVIVGDQDTPFLAHSERMAKTLPNGELAVIADAGHSPQFEAPEEWFTVLTNFLRKVKS